MDHITHDEFAGRLEKIMEPLISRPSFKAKIAFFTGMCRAIIPMAQTGFMVQKHTFGTFKSACQSRQD